MKKLKLTFLSLILILASWFSLGFGDNYFELSKNLDIFSSVFKELNTYYVDETEPGQLMKTAIDGMLESLDPYTNYIPESNIEDYRFMTTGQYGGIGALIHKEGEFIVIAEPYEGFPANKADLRAGDVLLKIDGNPVEGKSTSEISDFLKGQPGTSLSIEIERKELNGKTKLSKEVIRENIKIEDVPYYAMLDENTGYIKLVSFTQTAAKEYIAAFEDLKKQGMKNLVFDLRGNGGGLLIEAVKIVNTLVAKGSVVVETKGKLKEWDAIYFADAVPMDTLMPVVLLVDHSSASASEIVAGALQDYDRAVIIGKQTFGKGLVQQTRPLSYNSQLKVTVAKYYIPSGRCIQKIDYSHKNDRGIAESVPDSLIQNFETVKNKRKVSDGKGIKPDILSEESRLSPISASLIQNYHIFNFASEYFLKHPTIAEPKQFKLSDEEYKDFISFIDGKDFSYDTRSEKILKQLKKVAEEEKYFSKAEEEYAALEKSLSPDKNIDLIKFQTEIKELLDNEIVSRYYFQNGRIAQSLNVDPDILLALKTLGDTEAYQQILKGDNTQND